MQAFRLAASAVAAFLALLGCAGHGPRPDESPLLGFEPAQAAEQRDLEARFDRLIRADHLRDWMKRLDARPHHAGSAQGKENAEFMAGLFRSWGYDARIEEFRVLFPTPKARLLERVTPPGFAAALAEPPIPDVEDPARHDEGLPPYNAYSIDGDVTADLVYVNYGLPSDYEELERRGIDVKGRIVIARYGGSWRGIKPKAAAERGAVGCIIYSDPRDDGYFRGEVYPKGAFRNPQEAQRGSVLDLPLRPGDPLTPGVGSTPEARRIPLAEAETLTKIPVLPVSYEDARPVLETLGGPVAPEAWRGALPITYRLGPGPTRVRLKVQSDWAVVPAYNVIARMEGRERPDQWVLRGNHHDAWHHGAKDPVSGLVALLEEARAIGELARSGWRPRRTLVYCAWDAEEPGLLGSTEWAETHAAELREKAVAYINSDNNGRGFLRAGGSHVLEKLVNQAARDVEDPQKKISVADRLRAFRAVRGSPQERKDADGRPDLRLNPLGSGSDYTVFLDHLGIASLDVRFGGEDEGGSYHSAYDTFDHYVRFSDPGFAYGVALARIAGRIMLRLSEADVLPLEFTAQADAIATYADEVARLADALRQETERTNRLIREGRFEAAADPRETFVAPSPRTPVPPLDFGALKRAVAELRRSAEDFDRARREGGALPLEIRQALDGLLFRSERALIGEEGLPRRPWFKHLVYAPGFYTGYGVKTLPGVREAIEERNWAEAEAQIDVAARALGRYAAGIRRASELLRSSAR